MSDYNTEIVEPGDRFSKLAREVCVASFHNSPAITIMRGGAGMRAMDGYIWNLPEGRFEQCYEVVQSDGAGGKPQFFTLMNTPEAFEGLGWEVITMNADDLACRGGLPVMIASSNIDVKAITNENWHLCEALLRGFAQALCKSNLVLLTGETAVMKHSITAFCDTGDPSQLIMTWGATCLGLAALDIPPNGSSITPGMAIIGLRDKGYRCNGGTKFTNLILDRWGTDFPGMMHNPDARKFIEALVVPSQSYAKTVAALNGWASDGARYESDALLCGAAHITGGGVWSKLTEILPAGVGAVLDSMPEPAWVLKEAQRLSQLGDQPMSDHECYGTFHGGCGMMLICDKTDDDLVMDQARKDGHDPYIIGYTTESADNEVVTHSRFANGGVLSSLDHD